MVTEIRSAARADERAVAFGREQVPVDVRPQRREAREDEAAPVRERQHLRAVKRCAQQRVRGPECRIVLVEDLADDDARSRARLSHRSLALRPRPGAEGGRAAGSSRT